MNKWNIEYRIEKTNELVFWMVVHSDSKDGALWAAEQSYGQPARFITSRGTIVATANQAEGDNSVWIASVRAEMAV